MVGEFVVANRKPSRLFFGERKANFSSEVILGGFLFPLKHRPFILKIIWLVVCILSIC